MKTVPRFDSFHFGLFTCAICRGDVRGEERLSEELAQPLVGLRREVLIPSGRQSFHSGCLESVRPKLELVPTISEVQTGDSQ